MLRLVMYSDQVIAANDKVDARLVDLLAGRGRRIGYISSGPEPDRRFFGERQAYYARLGLDLAVFVDIGDRVDRAELASLLHCDAIHLPGGDTRSFLQLLKPQGLMSTLTVWAHGGGLLIGTSAGAILMTPTVAVDAIFCGEDPATVQDGGALDLVPFEYFPHLDVSPTYLPQLLAWSARTDRWIAACRDGDGVVVNGDIIETVGDIVWIKDGGISEPPPWVRDRQRSG